MSSRDDVDIESGNLFASENEANDGEMIQLNDVNEVPAPPVSMMNISATKEDYMKRGVGGPKSALVEHVDDNTGPDDFFPGAMAVGGDDESLSKTKKLASSGKGLTLTAGLSGLIELSPPGPEFHPGAVAVGGENDWSSDLARKLAASSAGQAQVPSTISAAELRSSTTVGGADKSPNDTLAVRATGLTAVLNAASELVPPASELHPSSVVTGVENKSQSKKSFDQEGPPAQANDTAVAASSSQVEESQIASPHGIGEQLNSIVSSVSSRWKSIGSSLGVGESTRGLHTIEATLVEEEVYEATLVREQEDLEMSSDRVRVTVSTNEPTPWWKRRSIWGGSLIIIVLAAALGTVLGTQLNSENDAHSDEPINDAPTALPGGNNETESTSNNSDNDAQGDKPSNATSPSLPEADVDGSGQDIITDKLSQRGPDVEGDAVEDWFGLTVALSADGGLLAVGADGQDGTSGCVTFFQWSATAFYWERLGLINGVEANERFGYSIDLSADGTIIAVGATDYDEGKGQVRVYHRNGNTFTQRGRNITGEAPSEFLGSAVSLSANGMRLAVGADHHTNTNGEWSGRVIVHEWKDDTSDWQELWQTFGEAYAEHLGRSVDLSADGSILAAGAPWGFGIDNTTWPGHVRVHKFDRATANWTEVGRIFGDSTDDYFGNSVSLSSDGKTVAIGAPYSDANGNNTGYVAVYSLNSNASWIKRGQINGEEAGGLMGYSVSLSANGKTVAMGSPYNDGRNVQVHNYDGSRWAISGQYLDGSSSWETASQGDAEDDRDDVDFDNFASALALSSNGKVLAIGAPEEENVRVFDIEL
eukprot:CAMPEP_0183724488 /NCGR_PEP_ID=MMETSP0737-20130205/17960_1 /TAXON_ID=385413 /ORGANISM="Thalassiosira miniscula, Strain CCMP1093" /LENGTH=818 /DNA_ID=CAMNT_0025955091 /DNA_START=167 /DNA_END=2623 /DNA_ORIENTATION=-